MENKLIAAPENARIWSGKAVRENLDEVLAFLDESLERLDCGPREQIQFDIAVEELFVNIADYAYPEKDGDAQIWIEESVADKTITVTFLDSGIPYDPVKKEDPDISLPAEERQIGGLGIYMAKKSMDEMTYQYLEGHNVLKIKKKLK